MTPGEEYVAMIAILQCQWELILRQKDPALRNTLILDYFNAVEQTLALAEKISPIKV